MPRRIHTHTLVNIQDFGQGRQRRIRYRLLSCGDPNCRRRDVVYRRVTFQAVLKACGKGNCGTCGGKSPAHGPYWQLIQWDRDMRRDRATYIGADLPVEVRQAAAITPSERTAIERLRKSSAKNVRT